MEAAWKQAQIGGQTENIAFIVADAESIPFTNNIFDYVICSEVLEHLLEPEQAIKEAYRILKKGGVFLITTPSAHSLGYTSNPLRIMEKIVSLKYDSTLPQYHGLHARYEFNRRNPEPEYGIHLHYTMQTLRRILSKNEFTIGNVMSFEIEVYPYLLASFIFNDVNIISRLITSLEVLAEKVPILKYLGQHLIVTATKNEV